MSSPPNNGVFAQSQAFSYHSLRGSSIGAREGVGCCSEVASSAGAGAGASALPPNAAKGSGPAAVACMERGVTVTSWAGPATPAALPPKAANGSAGAAGAGSTGDVVGAAVGGEAGDVASLPPKAANGLSSGILYFAPPPTVEGFSGRPVDTLMPRPISLASGCSFIYLSMFANLLTWVPPPGSWNKASSGDISRRRLSADTAPGFWARKSDSLSNGTNPSCPPTDTWASVMGS